MQHRQLTTAPRAAQCLPSASPGDVRHQPCKEPRTVSALIPTSWSCTLGSVSAENTTEQTVSWNDSRALSSGDRSMESLPASHCHSTATTTAPARRFLMPCQFTSNHTKSPGQAAHTATQVNEFFFSASIREGNAVPEASRVTLKEVWVPPEEGPANLTFFYTSPLLLQLQETQQHFQDCSSLAALQGYKGVTQLSVIATSQPNATGLTGAPTHSQGRTLTMADAPFLSPSWTESQGALSPAAFDCQTQGAPHL